MCRPVTGKDSSLLAHLSEFVSGIILRAADLLKAGHSRSGLMTACISSGPIIDMISGSSSLMLFTKILQISSEFSTGR